MTHVPAYTARERALFTEIATAEAVLAKALGFAPRRPGEPGYSAHHESFHTGSETIVTLAESVARRLYVAENNEPQGDISLLGDLADSWASNIEGWLERGRAEGAERSSAYGEGFNDGWSHALTILRTLSALVTPSQAAQAAQAAAAAPTGTDTT